MTIQPPVIAGLAWFAPGGIWLTPLFGKQWDKTVGFALPEKRRSPVIYYIDPLAGCIKAVYRSQ